MKKILRIMPVVLLSLVSFQVYAEHFVTVGKAGKVYDESNTKYVTVNQNNEELNIEPGMVFKSSERSPGWAKVEYSPGLHAFIQESILTADLKTPVPGNYDIKNLPSKKLEVSNSGQNWSASDGAKSYKGIILDNAVLFFDDGGQAVFSLVNLGNGGVVFSYDNNITKFF